MTQITTHAFLLLAGLNLLLPTESPKPREVTLRGTVIPLTAALADRQIVADLSPIADQLVLKQSDDTLIPLLSNGASKALFLDGRLRNRPTEIKAWQHDGLPFVEPVLFRVEEAGSLRIPEYYCDVCTITVRYPQDCPCCQGPMELRYNPMP